MMENSPEFRSFAELDEVDIDSGGFKFTSNESWLEITKAQ